MIIDFHPAHTLNISVQEDQRATFEYIDDMALADLGGAAHTYLEDGNPKASFGLMPVWKGRAQVWAVVGDNVNNWIALHKSVKSLMEATAKDYGIIRLEMTTEVGFKQSERWARMLGFNKESLMPSYGPDGLDHINWVRLWR